MSKNEVNYFIKVLTFNNYSSVKIHELLVNMEGDNCLSLRRIQQISKEYNEGRVVTDPLTTLNTGRPRVIRTNENIDLVENLIQEDNRLSVSSIAERLQLTQSTVYNILREELGMTSVTCRWVPYLLTDAHKQARIDACREVLNVLERRDMRNRLIVCDEKWLYLKSSNVSARCWMPADHQGDFDFERRTVVRRCLGHQKRMIIVASNFSGLNYFEILEDGGSINAERYIQFIGNSFVYFRNAGIATERIYWMHDNARPHTAHLTQRFLMQHGVNLAYQPPYSPDINLQDRYIFRNMETARTRNDFADVAEVMRFVQQFLRDLTVEEMNKQLENLRTHCTAVINANGCYVVKN